MSSRCFVDTLLHHVVSHSCKPTMKEYPACAQNRSNHLKTGSTESCSIPCSPRQQVRTFHVIPQATGLLYFLSQYLELKVSKMVLRYSEQCHWCVMNLGCQNRASVAHPLAEVLTTTGGRVAHATPWQGRWTPLNQRLRYSPHHAAPPAHGRNPGAATCQTLGAVPVLPGGDFRRRFRSSRSNSKSRVECIFPHVVCKCCLGRW